MCRIGCPIRVRIMWGDDLQSTTWLGDAMQFVHETEHVGNMLDDVATNDLLKLIVVEWIWKLAEVVNYICMAQRIRIDADRAGILVLSTTNVKNCFLSCAAGHVLNREQGGELLQVDGVNRLAQRA